MRSCAAHHFPKCCVIGMAISWTTMFAIEPPLVACVVSKPIYILTALRVTKEHRIAIPVLKEAPQGCRFWRPRGPDAERFNSWRAAWPRGVSK